MITIREIDERIATLEKNRRDVVDAANLQVAAINGRIAELKWLRDGQPTAVEMTEKGEGETAEVDE
ncbi:MAG: hypothetical protein OCU12_07810 [Methanophagales archaeon]|nr:hypothetical protein [Methanophagales archaeon]